LRFDHEINFTGVFELFQISLFDVCLFCLIPEIVLCEWLIYLYGMLWSYAWMDFGYKHDFRISNLNIVQKT